MLDAGAYSLQYRIVNCSSFTSHHEPPNMYSISAYGDGWESAPNSQFPQDIFIDFNRTVCLTNIKIVSHQTKIPSKVVISIAQETAPWNQIDYNLLTETYFSDNHMRNYRAREMQEADMKNTKCRYIKLSIPSFHQNQYNASGQVGIVSLVFSGTICQDKDDDYLIQLEREKSEAVSYKDYERAGYLKKKIDFYQFNKSRIDELKLCLNDAVYEENFDEAMQIKSKIEEIKHQSKFPVIDNEERQQIFHQEYQQNEQIPPHDPIDSVQNFKKYKNNNRIRESPPRRMELDEPPLHDEIPAPMRRRREIMESDPNLATRPIRVSEAGSVPEVDNDPSVDPLSPEDRRKAQPLIDAFGEEESVQKFFSKSIVTRRQGIKQVVANVLASSPDLQETLYSLTMGLLLVYAKDNNPHVAATAFEYAGKLSATIESPGRGAVAHYTEPILAVAFTRLGQSNSALRLQCSRFIMWASRRDVLGINLVFPRILDMSARLRNSLHTRLGILVALLKEDEILLSVDPDSVTKFAIWALNDPKEEVRTEAADVLVALTEDERNRNLVDARLSASHLPQMTKSLVVNVIKARDKEAKHM